MKKVEIYTKSYCPYCVKAKQLFKIKSIAFMEIDVTDDTVKLEEMIKKSGGKKTVPQVFIDDQHIGGCDDLYALNEKDALDSLIFAS